MFNLNEYLQDLEQLVNIDSGSRDAVGIGQVAEFFKERFVALGWQVKVHEFDPIAGPCLEISNTAADKYDILFMGHMDTVFKKGTVAQRPFSVDGNIGRGPGIVDCKAGLLLAYYALRELSVAGQLNTTAICLAFNCDEEISSVYSRPWLEELSKKSEYVLVVEPARANGNLVNKRKGIGRYHFEFQGVAAHAGTDHEKGRSAITELANWIVQLDKKTNYQTGTTVNVGFISGGTVANVVADKTVADMDVRYYDVEAVEEIEKLMNEMQQSPFVPGVQVNISGGITRPSMVPTEKTMQLCAAIDQIGAKHQIEFGWAATGGGSDGSFAAALGIPTIDGLGPVGGGTHSDKEYLDISSVEPRFKLLRDLVAHIAIVNN